MDSSFKNSLQPVLKFLIICPLQITTWDKSFFIESKNDLFEIALQYCVRHFTGFAHV